MSTVKSPEMEFALDLGIKMGDVMRSYFYGEGLAEGTKTDQTPVTEADLYISDQVTRAYTARGRGVVSEERGRTAKYGDPDAEYLDPIDGTQDFIDGRVRLPRHSIAAFSMGSVVDGRFARGVVDMPLLHRRRTYWAEEGQGAFRMRDGEISPLAIDNTLDDGIILTSLREHRYANRLARCGLEMVRLSGAVFKANCVTDQSLLHEWEGEYSWGKRVIGWVSLSAAAHDYAGSIPVIREAGGVACNLEGGEPSLEAGKQGCIFANSEQTRDRLLEALHTA